jgi:nitrous oxidase accessory protein NosD
MMRRCVIAFAALVPAHAAMAADWVAYSTAELDRAIANATAGDRILLAPGDYGRLSLIGRDYAATVAIEAQDRAAPPRFQSIAIERSSNITLRGIAVNFGPTAKPQSDNIVTISHAQSVRMEAMRIASAPNGVAGDDASGVNVLSSADVVIADSVFDETYRGVLSFESDRVLIRRNVILRAGVDGVAARGADDLVIEDNYIAEFLTIDPVALHPDAVQIWSKSAGRANRNVTVRRNLIRRGEGDPAQGIFMRTPELRSVGVVIEDNVIDQSMGQGVAIENAEGAVIRRNTLLPARKGETAPGIDVRNASVAVEGNLAAVYRNLANPAAPGNILIQFDNPYAAGFVERYVAEPSRRAEPADYAALTEAGARGHVADLWLGDPAAPAQRLDFPALVADINVPAQQDRATPPLSVARIDSEKGAYLLAGPDPRLSAAQNISIEIETTRRGSGAKAVLAAVPGAFIVQTAKTSLYCNVTTQSGAIAKVSMPAPTQDASKIQCVYDGDRGEIRLSVNGTTVSATAPAGPVSWRPTQGLAIGGASWGDIYAGEIARVVVTR